MNEPFECACYVSKMMEDSGVLSDVHVGIDEGLESDQGSADRFISRFALDCKEDVLIDAEDRVENDIDEIPRRKKRRRNTGVCELILVKL